ncbi:transglycosylase SLT domain-containing protein [Nocardia rhizosphaerae]|uniref:Transglycosylase SLT domain-containing protein n=1 Tax=Nocardia rhizosphaerae TaxID=1691571 RepID=A0ABV8LF69_9NOCA
MPGEYKAGTAYLSLKPKLADQFRAQVKTLIKPINESLAVTLKPQLTSGFRAQVKDLAKTAAEGSGAKIEFGHKLAPGFRASLKNAAKLEGQKATAKVYFTPELKTGFQSLLRGKVNAAAATVQGTITLKLSEAGVRQKIRELKNTLPAAQLRVKLDLSEAVTQLEEFRTAVAAQPLSMNVNVDTTAAVAQLMALRTLASDVGDRVNSLGGASIGRTAQRLTGNIFTRPIRAIRLQVQLDRDSVTRAEAELANVISRLELARQRQGDTLDRLTLAQQRHDEVLANGNSTLSQRTAATQRLARAQREHADATGRLSSLMGQEADANNRLDRARNRQGSIMSSLSAAWRGFQSAAVDAISNAAKNLFSLSSLAGIAKVALIALAAVSLIPLIGQIAQAAGVLALLPAAVAGFGAVIATVVAGMSGIGDAFDAAKKASEGAAAQAKSQAKAVAAANKQVESAARGVVSAQRGVVSAEKGIRSAQKESLAAQKALTTARKDARKELDDLNRALGRTKLDEQGAALAVAEAQQELNEVLRDSSSDAIDRARAQYNLDRALADQEDTLRNSRELAEQVTEANEKGVEGSDQVVAAKERVADAAESEAEAQQSLIDAHQSLADAQQQLAEANQAVVEAMNEGSDAAEEFARKMAALSPAAQDFVRKWLEVKPLLSTLADGVQENLFDGMGDSISSLVTKWIPTLETGLGRIATAINGGLRRAFADFESEATRSKLEYIFDKVADSIGPIIDGIRDMIQGFLSLAQAGSDFLPSGAQGFADLMARFREWAEDPENQQKFKDFIDKSLAAFGRLKDLVVEVGRLIGALFSGSEETGEDMLTDITNKLKEWADWLKSPEGQQAVKDFFADVKSTADSIVNALEKIIGLMDTVGNSAAGKMLGGIFTDTKTVKDENGNEVEVDKTFTDRLGEVGSGLGTGLKYNIPVNFAISWVSNGWEFVGKQWNQFTLKFGEAWDGFTSSVATGAGTVGTWFGEIGSKAESLNSAIGSAWASITSHIADNIGEIISTATGFGKLKSEASALVTFFGNLVSDIGIEWDKLPGKLSGAINGLIDALNTLGGIWNKVASKLGLPQWDPMDHIGGSTGGMQMWSGPGPAAAKRWQGGPITGPGGPTEDRVPILASPGEHMWTAAEVKAAGGHDAMYKMRAAALKGGGTQSQPAADGPGRYADGGIVSTSDPLDPIQAQLWDLVRTAIPGAVLTSGKRFQDVGSGYDLHMQGKAIDLGGPMKEIARWIYNTYPQSAELIHWPLDGWQNLDEGQPYDFGAATNAAHMDHVHWGANDFLGNLSDEEKASIFARIGSAISGAVTSGRNALANSLLLNPLRAAANSVPEIAGLGDAGKIPRAFAQKLVEALASKILGSGSSGGGGANYVPSEGVEQWRDMALEAMRREGFNADDPAQVNAMMAQIQSESGGNPNILQQVQDVNSGGNEAQGLLQVIPGTFAAYRDPSLPNDRTDPMANMVAALRYYKATYGMDLTTMWGQGHGYDQGGIFPNGTFGWNTSGLPEAVLTNPQWRMFQDFVANMTNQAPQTLEGPAVTGVDTGTDGTSSYNTSGVETFEEVGTNAQERFSSALSTGFEDLVSTTLDPLGLPDPRDLIPSAVTDYGSTLASWQQARSSSAEASQTLAQSGYQAASVPAAGAANTVIQRGSEGGSLTTIDNSTTINLTTPNVDEAFRKAELIRDMRALQHTATARG